MKHLKAHNNKQKSMTRLLAAGAAGLAALGFVGGVTLATGSTGSTGSIGNVGNIANVGSAPLHVQAAAATRVVRHEARLTRSGSRMSTTELRLHPMPVGTVSFQRRGDTIDAWILATGLTPGSTHLAEIAFNNGRSPIMLSQFSANSTGQVDATVSGTVPAGGSLEGGTFQIWLDTTAADGPIALAPVQDTSTGQAVRLRAFNPTGAGQLAGHARLNYDSQQQTLTVTIDATGVEPGSIHAAHIHAGSCAAQGAVLYMLPDLHADSHGRIDQTDVLHGITNFTMPADGWYINIHRGDSATILDAAGNPTPNFRPLLCADLPPTSSPVWSSPVTHSGNGQTEQSQGANTMGSGGNGLSSTPQRTTPPPASATAHYNFRTLDNLADPTFNQLLGINDQGTIAGYFGSGETGHPNKGYLLGRPYTSYRNENFPGSVQTQVTGLNNRGYTVGFWADASNDNFGFAEHDGTFTTYQDPATGNGTVNQLLGVNDQGMAVGFYTDSSNANHAYEVNLATHQYRAINVPGGTNTVASGISENGDITGFSTNASGVTFGWLLHRGHLSTFDFPGSSSTTPLGINADDEIVGAYVDATGNTHGFTLTNRSGHEMWTTVNDPNGADTTTVNGVNDLGQLVGFYTDSAGNTDGFLATK